MPTFEDLGKLVKAKFPGAYDSMSDLEVGQKVRAKYPNAYTEYRGSGGEVAQKARKNLAENLQKGAAETYAQDIADVKGRAIKEGALLVGAAAAAPFTGGASLPAALAISGGAGAAASLVGQAGQIAVGSSEAPKDLPDLTTSAGWDAASFMLGEAGGRAITSTLKTLVPKLAIRSAAKTDRGLRALEDMYANTSNDLYAELKNTSWRTANVANPPPGTALVQTAGRRATKALISGATEDIPKVSTATGAPWVNVAPELDYIVNGINNLPRGVGRVGQRYSGVTDAAKSMLEGMAEHTDVNLAKGTFGAFQPLDGLIRMQHSLQTAAWKETGLAAEEIPIFKKGAEKLQVVITDALKDVSPEAVALYKRTNDIVKAQTRNTIVMKLGSEWATALGRRAVSGAAGAGAGYYYSGGNIKAALYGAAVGAAIGPASAYAVEKAANHPQAAKLLGKAIDFAFQGKGASAKALAARAFVVAGVREDVRSMLDDQKEVASEPPQSLQGSAQFTQPPQ